MEYEACRESFSHFLTHWTFTNRETGEVMRFASLWPGQVKFAELMERESWIYALKAGKLGFTELECAFDAWVALFRQRNARVHIFSRDANAARELLGYVRFGIRHLPGWLRPRFAAEGNTQTTIRLAMGLDDVRSIVSYASGPTVSIDQSAAHCHVDELAHMPHPEETWSAVETTVAPAGSCHIVTRGHGDANYA
ncbi:MAG: hypothetical protein IT307_03330, partial [Chloroflexi bacterium]|nr:hypothetical protein [Chloroflexota bacterium]